MANRQAKGSLRTGQSPGSVAPLAPEVDFLLVADAADVVGGKLYMLGGAFDRLWLGNFAEDVSFCVALGVVVPWAATNMLHQVSIVFQTEDGSTLAQIGANLNVGRPPTAQPGESFRAIVAVRIATKLPGPGAYVLVASLPGSAPKRTVIYAAAVNASLGVPPA